MSIAQDYLTAIVQRCHQEMEPKGYIVNWADKPRQAKFYPGVDGFALPISTSPGKADPIALGPQPRPDVPPVPPVLTLPMLGDLLLHSYARLSRRLRISANNDTGLLPRFADAKWSRGTASGGGIHPVSVYWVTGTNGPAVPGVYHYFPFQHEMKRLISGDVTGEVEAALGDRPGSGPFLVLGLKFWQNAFKYNSFSYHATGFDVGTVLQTWRMLAATYGLDLTPSLWFDETRINRLLNVRPEDEGIFAIVALGPPQEIPSAPSPPGVPTPQVRYRDQELSRTVRRFETLGRVHAATVEGATLRPDPNAVKAAEISVRQHLELVPLPAPETPALGMRRALRSRMSSFGRFEGARPIRATQLATVLAAGTTAARFDCDVLPDGEDVTLVKQYVFVNHVTGVEPGVYEYSPADGELRRITAGSRGQFLQRHYTLSNYNLEQAAAVIVPSVRVPALLDALGDRGYRLATAVTGAVAQACYTASAAVGIGCGVALGLDPVAYLEELDLRGGDEIPMLLMMIGHERAGAATYRYELV